MFKQVSGAFEFCAAVTSEELGEVEIPEFECDGVGKVIYPSFVDAEGFFVISIFFKEVGVVNDDLGSCNTEIEYSIVDFFGRFDCTAALF